MTKEIVKKISEFDNIALFHHIMPDGDSLSSSYGLMLAIKKAYPNKNVVFCANRDALKQQFNGWGINEEFVVDSIDNTYLTIMGDSSVSSRIDMFEEFNKGAEKIIFDHHRNECDVEDALFWHEPTFPASTIQAIMIAEEMNVEFDEDIAYFLMIGLLTDTGSFTYSLGNPQPVEQFAKLLHFISDERMDKFHKIMKTRTQSDIELQKIIFENIKYEGDVAYSVFDKSIVDKFGAKDVKIKINSIGNIENYPIWAFFTETQEQEDFPWEISLRSNGPNVNETAVKFNGGGHLRASGAKMKSIDELKDVLKSLNKK